MSKVTDEYGTPKLLFYSIERAAWNLLSGAQLQFTLDAAAAYNNRKCEKFLTGPCVAKEVSRPIELGPCRCGLCSSWKGETVWLNPPYSHIHPWIRKCLWESMVNGVPIAALVLPSIGAQWFRAVWRTASEIWFLSSRVDFDGLVGSNNRDSMLVFWLPSDEERGPGPEVRLWDYKMERFITREVQMELPTDQKREPS